MEEHVVEKKENKKHNTFFCFFFLFFFILQIHFSPEPQHKDEYGELILVENLVFRSVFDVYQDNDGMFLNLPRVNVNPYDYASLSFIIYILLIVSLLVYSGRKIYGRIRDRSALTWNKPEKSNIKELNRQQTLVISSLTNELKTHLSVIKSNLDELDLVKEINRDGDEKLKKIKSSMTYLSQIIHQLMDIQQKGNLPEKLNLQRDNIERFIKNISPTSELACNRCNAGEDVSILFEELFYEERPNTSQIEFQDPMSEKDLGLTLKGLLPLDNHRYNFNHKDKNFIRKSIEVIYKNLDNHKFTVDDLASELDMSTTLVYLKHKKLLNISAKRFIIMLRFKKAIDLMVRSDSTISEIAYEVGFSDPNYFSRSFKKIYNKTPSQYRAELMNQ